MQGMDERAAEHRKSQDKRQRHQSQRWYHSRLYPSSLLLLAGTGTLFRPFAARCADSSKGGVTWDGWWFPADKYLNERTKRQHAGTHATWIFAPFGGSHRQLFALALPSWFAADRWLASGHETHTGGRCWVKKCCAVS